jgi:23S rRNA pseudouridine2605 synthase
MGKPDNSTPPAATMRLNKCLARAGFGSRRSVEELISAGRVKLNGEVVRDMGRQVDPENDQLEVDDRPAVMPRDFRVYAFHKPLDVVSTLKSQGGQASLLPYRLQADLADRFMPVGRLDSESTGLLLWTDDGQLNQDLCQPLTGLWKTYQIQSTEDLSPTQLKHLIMGKIEIDGRKVRPCRLEQKTDGTTRDWVMEIHEGRRRQIRRMFRKVGARVRTLHRTDIGPVSLGLLRPGDFRRLSHHEVEALRSAVAKPAPKPSSRHR